MIIYAAGTSPDLPVHYFYGGTEKLVFEKDSWTWYKCNTDGTRTKLYGVTVDSEIPLDRSSSYVYS